MLSSAMRRADLWKASLLSTCCCLTLSRTASWYACQLQTTVAAPLLNLAVHIMCATYIQEFVDQSLCVKITGITELSVTTILGAPGV